MLEKEKFMKICLKEAKKAYDKGELPIGAVIVKDGQVIAKAHNLRNTKKIATCHAEILAIEQACKKLGDWRLLGCEMYVSLEPCSMCAGAILNSRIEKLYFGAYEKKSGAVLSNFNILYKGGLNHETQVEGGILEKDCSELLKKFFLDKRIVK